MVNHRKALEEILAPDEILSDPTDIARYATAVEPWIAGDMNQVVAIEPQFISGIRLADWCA